MKTILNRILGNVFFRNDSIISSKSFRISFIDKDFFFSVILVISEKLISDGRNRSGFELMWIIVLLVHNYKKKLYKIQKN